MERTLVALWFADIAGYSTYAAADESGALKLVEALQEVSRQTVPQFKGRIVKFLGDAVLAQFASADLAVRAAASLNHTYTERMPNGKAESKLRIGVHLGDVMVAADGDLYGDGVNIAARIQQAADPGQVVVSEDVWRQLRGRREFQFDSLGEQSLKGVSPIGLYLVNIEAPAVPVQIQPSQGEPIRSLAVLPFSDLSPERDQEYFGDGIAEEILNALTKLGRLHVASRTSSFAFRGQNLDVRDIGTRLGVEALLEGSIRKAGQRLRISVQLVDARNGYHVWSEQFDREVSDVFEIQDEIANCVVKTLHVSVGRRDVRHLVKQSTGNVEAYEFYLRGRKLFQMWTRDNITLAKSMYERAVGIDPNFAAAWAGLATAHVYLHGCDNQPHLVKAREAVARALESDSQSAEAHVAAGQALSMEQNYGEAAAAFERAMELDPTLVDAPYYYARSCFKEGELEKSLRLFRQAREVQPENFEAIYLQALVLTKLGRREEAMSLFEEALQLASRHLELHPNDARTYVLGAGALARSGQAARAEEWAERGMSLAPSDDAILYNAGCALAIVGRQEHALNALERAITAGLAGGDWIRQDPDWEGLYDHPRFQSLVERLAHPN